MADDARISTALPSHPKTKKLRRRLGDGGCWSLVCLFLWTASNRWDGSLADMSDEDIELAADWMGEPGALVKALIEVGFLDGEPGAYMIHDWHDHNPWAASRGQRQQAARDAAARKWGAGSSDATRAQRLAEARAKGRHSAEEWHALVAICGGVCVRCGSSGALVKDHITPIYQGGSDGIDNLQPLCKSCNSSKGPDATDHRPANWREHLQIMLGSLRIASEMPAYGSHQRDEMPAHHPTQPNTTQPNPTTKAIAPSAPAKRATQMPEGFDLSEEMRQFARQQGVDPAREFPAFCDYHRSKGSTFKDWPAAWRTWVRNATKFGGKGKAPPGGYLNETRDDLLAALQRQSGEVQ